MSATAWSVTINGHPGAATATLDVINPATEAVIATVPDCGSEDLDAAVAAATAAFPGWRDTPLAERQRLVGELGKRIEAHQEELTRLLTSEHGKPLGDALVDVLGGAEWCKTFAAMDIPVVVTEDSSARRVEVRRTPIGVVGAIAPWNFPVILAMIKSAPALVAGNTVILKPSPFTPLTTLRIGQLVGDLLPAGVFTVITGGDALGPLITNHPGIAKISFTGSSATGRRVMESAAKTLKRVTLELGGNDAAIILPDVDVPAVAKQIFFSAFGNSGQVCVAVKRVYVHEDIHEQLVEELIRLVSAAKMGDGTEQGIRFGPMQNKPQYERVLGLIQDSKDQGYNIVAGGQAIPGPGYFIPLTLVDSPPEHSRIVQEEQFGPVLPILTFSDIDDVIKRANDSPYGLGGQVWSNDEDQAIEIGLKLETGNVFINQSQMIFAHAPFGGHKLSGLGVEAAEEGLYAFTNAQTVSIRKRKKAA